MPDLDLKSISKVLKGLIDEEKRGNKKYERLLDALEDVHPKGVKHKLILRDLRDALIKAAADEDVHASTFQDVLIGLVGGKNIAAEIAGWGQMSLEEIVTRNPQVVIFGEGSWVPTTVGSLSDRTGWGEIAAVVDGRVYGIDTNLVDRPGPRLVDALEEMALMIHPELFE